MLRPIRVLFFILLFSQVHEGVPIFFGRDAVEALQYAPVKAQVCVFTFTADPWPLAWHIGKRSHGGLGQVAAPTLMSHPA